MTNKQLYNKRRYTNLSEVREEMADLQDKVNQHALDLDMIHNFLHARDDSPANGIDFLKTVLDVVVISGACYGFIHLMIDVHTLVLRLLFSQPF